MLTDATRCPAPEALEQLLGETLAEAERATVEAHIETCAACQARLEQLVAPTAVPARPSTIASAHVMPRPEPDEAFLDQLRQMPFPSAASAVPSAAREAAPPAPAPAQIGPYEILGRLGRGGMGTVYRARHRDLDKIVALKVLPADRVDESVVARFRNEMKAAGQLAHPNIVEAHDAGLEGGTYYLAMDFVDGSDLSDLVDRLGALPVPDACELIRQAAVGLQHACECGLAHRDVKPSNLMLARDGVVKVLDLGLARSLADLPEPDRLTATGMLLGTADYIAPEQIDQAHSADARADVYGLGGTLFFLLTSAPPFGAKRSWLEKLRAHTEAPVPDIRQRRAEVPAALAALLARMLAKKPDDRPATPGEVAEALRPFTSGAAVSELLAREAPGARPAVSTPSPKRGNRGALLRYSLTALAGAAVALLVAIPFLGPRSDRTPNRPPDPPDPTGGTANKPPIQPDDKKDSEEPDGVRLTYGLHGPVRPDHRVLPDEEVHMEFTVRGVGKDAKGEVDISIAGELSDRDGKKQLELLPVPRKGPLYLGGSTLTSQISCELAKDQRPGDYTLRAKLTDRVRGRNVNVEHPVYVLRPEFGAVRLRLTHDDEGKLPAGANLTVGQQFFVHMRITNFEHKDGGIQITVQLSALDHDGKDTMPTPLKPLNIKQKVNDAFTYFDLKAPSMRAIMAGEAVIVVELEDVISGKKAKYELPVVIHPPRSVRTPNKEQ